MSIGDNKMVDYHTPEPKFKAPLDINEKEEPPILLAEPKKQEPVILANVGQQERDELAARVRAINAGKTFDAPPVMPKSPPIPPRPTMPQPPDYLLKPPPLPFPKTGVKQPKGFTPPTIPSTPPKVDEKPWYKRRQTDVDSPKPTGRQISINAIVKGLPKAQADMVRRQLMAIHQEHVESGVPGGFNYTSSGIPMWKVDYIMRHTYQDIGDFDALDRKIMKHYRDRFPDVEPEKPRKKGWFRK
jgi:hypothetical protein